MSVPDPQRTVPRTPPAPEHTADHVPAADTGSRAADESSAEAGTPADGQPPGPPAVATRVRPPSDLDRLEADAQARAAEGVPGYVVLGELGKGGMGVVYKARHVKLNRVVALKTVLGGERVGRGELIRFLAEAEAVAAIRHEHVVQVYDYGEADGRPYMALEFCPGGTLGKLLPKDGGAARAPAEMAALVAKVARGVAAAHALGIVHRDLKPGNVFLDEAGVPKVADFGLAKRGGGAEVTRTGQVMGTPAYMSPEQAKGETKFVGPQADVWALGVILYEALTGARPFQGSVQEILAKVQNAEPTPPRKAVSAVPRDLELICLKCLAKPAHERYATAKELADDLDRYARGEPISVRPAGPVERAVKWVKRNPVISGAAAAVVVALAAGGTVGWVNYQLAREQGAFALAKAEDADREAKEAHRQRGIADAQSVLTQQKATALGIELGRNRRLLTVSRLRETAGAVGRGLAAAARNLLDAFPAEDRCLAWGLLRRQAEGSLFTLYPDAPVGGVAVSGDGRRVFAQDSEGTVWVWDAETGVPVTSFRKRPRTAAIPTEAAAMEHLTVVSTDADGSRFLVAGDFGTAVLIDVASRRLLRTLRGHAGRVTNTAMTPDGRRAVTADGSGAVRVWDLETERVVAELTPAKGRKPEPAEPGRAAVAVGLTADGRRAVTNAGDGVARVWDAGSGRLIAELKPRKRPGGPEGKTDAVGVAIVPDGRRAAAGSPDGTVTVWDVDSGRVLSELGGHSGSLLGVALSPDGLRVASGSGARVRVWDAATGGVLAELAGHGETVAGLAFMPDARRLVTGAHDRTVKVWDPLGDQALVLRAHARPVLAVALSADGRVGATASADRTARVWNVATGRLTAALKGHGAAVTGVALSADGRVVVTGSDDRTARVWEVATGRQVAALVGHAKRITAVAVSADGRRVVTGSQDKTARVWDPATGAALAVLEGHGKEITAVAVSPDGRRVATGSGMDPLGDSRGDARLWEADSGRLLGVLGGHHSGVGGVAFSPDGSKVATLSGESVRVWDADTRRAVAEVRGHAGEVAGVAFAPGGRLVTAAADGLVYVWDAESGQLLCTLNSPLPPPDPDAPDEDDPEAIAVCAGGDRVMVGLPDGSARLWWAPARSGEIELRGDGTLLAPHRFTRDGRRAVFGPPGGEQTVLDLQTGAPVPEAVPAEAELSAKPPAGWLASRSPDLRTLRLVPPAGDEELAHRRAATRPSPAWHARRQAEARAAADPAAEAFHREWERRARSRLGPTDEAD